MTQSEAPAPSESSPAPAVPKLLKIALGLGAVVAIVVAVFAFLHVSGVNAEHARVQAIADEPTEELDAYRAEMKKELAGEMEERGTMSIDKAIEEYIKDSSWRPKKDD